MLDSLTISPEMVVTVLKPDILMDMLLKKVSKLLPLILIPLVPPVNPLNVLTILPNPYSSTKVSDSSDLMMLMV